MTPETVYNPFSGIVGLSFDGLPTSTRSVWADDIPGMSVELADNLRPEDAATLWGRVERVSAGWLLSALEKRMMSRVSFRHILSRTLADKPTLLPTLSGVITALAPATVSVVANTRSEQIKLSIPVVSFVSLTTAPVLCQLKIQEEGNSVLLFDGPVVAVLGLNNVMVKVSLPLRMTYVKVIVTLTPQGAASLTLGLVAGQETADSCALEIPTMTGTDTRKLHVKAELRCDFAGVISGYADTLAWSYAYMCASVLLSEKLSSNLMNVFTNTNRMDTGQRVTDYQKEAYARLETAVSSIIGDLETAGSELLTCSPDVQGGYFMGSYV